MLCFAIVLLERMRTNVSMVDLSDNNNGRMELFCETSLKKVAENKE